MINQINASQSYSVAAAVKTTSQNTTVANGSTAQTERSQRSILLRSEQSKNHPAFIPI